jgi:hypothetical protein
VVPSDSEAFNKSGLIWATGGAYHVQIQKVDEVIKIEVDNTPIDSLRWVGIDSRMEGGVAYKVVTPQGWLVDLREDVVLECLHDGSISHSDMIGGRGAGTYFTGGFVWVVMGSQSRLVKVGSKLHSELVESDMLGKAGPLTDFEVGGIYQQRNGKQYVVIAKGTAKGKKFLLEQVSGWSKCTVQQQVDGSIGHLVQSNIYPPWHWSGSFKAVKQVGKVIVPEGLADKHAKKVKQIQTSATLWNKGTSR